MIRKLLGIVAVVALASVVAAAIWVERRDRCADRCNVALEHADRLAAGGDLRAALTTIDEEDSSCSCGRFTDGDEPPEYASARAYLQRLRADGRVGEANEIAAAARGPILRELATALAR
jgi:hypothetical protein